MLNYRQLHYFCCVARYGGITRAAEHLHLTPQTISGQLAELEQELGTALFRRVGRRLELTPSGKMALAHAEEIFQLGSQLEQGLRSGATSSEPLFRVGIADSVPKSIACQLLLPALALKESFKLICLSDKPEKLFAELAIHQLDLVIADRPLPSTLGVKAYNHVLGHSSLAFYAAPDLAARYQPFSPSKLHGAPLLLPGDNTVIQPLLLNWFQENQVQPHVICKFDDTALMKDFGKAGAGIFPAPVVLSQEIIAQYGVSMLATIEDVSAHYYAISVERQITHPAVLAISTSAKQTLFGDKRR